MGNQQSSAPFNQAIAAAQARTQAQASPPPTPDPAAQCTANKIQLTNLNNETRSLQNRVDRCDPSVKTARQAQDLQDTNRAFVKDIQSKSNILNDSIQNQYNTGSKLIEAVRLLKQYKAKMDNEEKRAYRTITKMEHKEREYRRDFLDNDPTEGVPWHVFGFQTSDDKAMLTFWISSLIAFSLLTHVILKVVMPTATLWSRVKVGTVVVIAALLLCYILITRYG
jgi:hypothetical protein